MTITKHILTILFIVLISFGLKAQNQFADSFCGINGPLVAQNNPLSGGGGFFSQSSGYELAAAFIPPSNRIINQICISGGYFDGCTPNVFLDYKFVIYADNGGQPGAPLLGPINVAGSHVLTGNIFTISGTNLPPTEELAITLNFPAFAVTAGTTIWISVSSTGVQTPSCRGFVWVNSQTGDGFARTRDGGITWDDTDIGFRSSLFIGEYIPPVNCADALADPTGICGILELDPSNPIATLDCDMSGVNNQTECANGGDPSNGQDDSCDSFNGTSAELCALIASLPADHPLAIASCDGGESDNATECANGGDPLNGQDDGCDSFTGTSAELCALIAGLPADHPLALADCDGGDLDNATECANGGDPLNGQDDGCDSFTGTSAELCALIAGLPADHPLALASCDGGELDNATECANGGDPLNDQDDGCNSFTGTGLELCELIAGLPADHPLALANCDGIGEDNATECANGFNPTDPAIPTLGEWGLIALTLLFAILGAVAIRQKEFSLG